MGHNSHVLWSVDHESLGAGFWGCWKLSKIGFEIYSSHKYEVPLIEKGFAIHTLPEFIINITDQIISEKKIGKLFISIHSEYHQYEMTYLTNDKRNNKKTINKIFESFSLQKEDIISDIKNDKTEEVVSILLQLRNEARRNKDYALGDKIRDMLKEKGISINDKDNESSFSID